MHAQQRQGLNRSVNERHMSLQCSTYVCEWTAVECMYLAAIIADCYDSRDVYLRARSMMRDEDEERHEW